MKDFSWFKFSVFIKNLTSQVAFENSSPKIVTVFASLKIMAQLNVLNNEFNMFLRFFTSKINNLNAGGCQSPLSKFFLSLNRFFPSQTSNWPANGWQSSRIIMHELSTWNFATKSWIVWSCKCKWAPWLLRLINLLVSQVSIKSHRFPLWTPKMFFLKILSFRKSWDNRQIRELSSFLNQFQSAALSVT